MKYFITILLLTFFSFTLQGQIIYKAGTSLITGFWAGEGTLSEITTDNPYEGGQHYRFVYNFTAHWAGYGLNLTNWGTTAPVDFSGFTHLRIAYRGVSAEHTFNLQLNSVGGEGVFQVVGVTALDYVVIDISLEALSSGTPLSLESITDINMNVVSDNASGNGTVYFDAIELVSNPLSILDFVSNTDCSKGQVTLIWQLDDLHAEIEIQKSIDALSWHTIRLMMADNRKMKLTIPLDSDALSTYYRIKVTPANHEVYYSNIKSAICEEKGVIKIFPNPAKDHLTISGDHSKNGVISFEEIYILNSLGQTIRHHKGKEIAETNIEIALDGLPPGQYYLRIIHGNGLIKNVMFIIQ